MEEGDSVKAGDVLVQPADAVVMKVLRRTHISVVQISASGICVVSPMEGQ